MSSSNDNEPTTGFRDCLTPSQTRALLSLWARFFAACTIAPLPPSPEEGEISQAANGASTAPTSGVDSESDAAVARNREASSSGSSAAGGRRAAGASSGSAGRSTFAAATRDKLARNAAANRNKAGNKSKEAGASSSPNSASASTSDLNAHARSPTAGEGNAARSSTPPPGGNARSRGKESGELTGVEIGGGQGDSPSRIELIEGKGPSGLRTTDTSGKPLVEDYTSGKHIPRDDRAKDNLRLIEEAKEMRIFLDRYGGERLREVFWKGLIKGEHPDGVMLRFLRSRKWDVDRALNVIGSTARFRVENDVDGLLKSGELEMVKTRGGYNIFHNGISYVYGALPTGEPVYVIEVGSHYSSNQTQLELQRGVIYMQEWLSLLMPPPVETKVVIFNLKSFGIRNMDWWCVFFMVKTIERFYPETLKKVYVHCPPWIFKPIWFILRPLLDPVVREKVSLTSSTQDLGELIPEDHLPHVALGGTAEWEYAWPPAQAGENDVQKDEETAREKWEAFMETATQFEKATREYIRMFAKAASPLQRQVFGRMSTNTSRRIAHQALDASSFSEEDGGDVMEPDGAQEMRGRRDVLATKLRVNFLELRPYTIGKSKYDRWGVMCEDGTVRWEYKKLDGTVEEQILGENASLPVLKAGLELIEKADAASKEAKERAAEEKEARRRKQQSVTSGRTARRRAEQMSTSTSVRQQQEQPALSQEVDPIVPPSPATLATPPAFAVHSARRRDDHDHNAAEPRHDGGLLAMTNGHSDAGQGQYEASYQDNESGGIDEEGALTPALH